ncbi:MAG: pre-peptidase C-terminal domain-containing protein [Candidatus Sumerlaeota bacterium]|nr:pre-peptidase C-terminal domain-containing protein [Candidatus Sumerlaeota bacterium]
MKPNRCTRGRALRIALAIVLLSSARAFGQANPAEGPDNTQAPTTVRLLSQAALGIVDCPPNLNVSKPSRTVVQYIDGRLCEWDEYDQSVQNGVPQFSIVMKQPYPGPMSKEDAQVLLSASRQWVQGLPNPKEAVTLPPDDPRLTAPPRYRLFSQRRPALAPPAGAPQPDTSAPTVATQAPRLAAGAAGKTGAGAGAVIPNTLVGPDNRTRVSDATIYPWNTMCYIYDEFPDNSAARATGYLVGPHVMLTAGHMVYDGAAGGYATALELAPGQNQKAQGHPVVRPFGDRWAAAVATNSQYRGSESFDYDYGAAFFNASFGGMSTFMPLEFDTTPSAISIAGYPVAVQNETNSNALWLGAGSITSFDSRLFYHNVDTSPGNSGSAIWTYNPTTGARRVVGIHTFGGPNGGTRLVSLNHDTIVSWMQWAPTIPDDKYEENDSLSQAYDLSGRPQTWLSTINGSGVQLDDDWYRIQASSGALRLQVDCRFTNAQGDIDIALYDAAGTLLASSTGTTDREFIDVTVASAGYYYVRVYGPNAGNPYDLWWTAVATTPARIVVTRPWAGAWVKQGVAAPIRWTSSGTVGKYVTIMLYHNNVYLYQVIKKTANDNVYWCTPSVSLTPGDGYRVKVRSVFDTTVWGNSGTFTLTAP